MFDLQNDLILGQLTVSVSLTQDEYRLSFSYFLELYKSKCCAWKQFCLSKCQSHKLHVYIQ